MDKVKMSLKEYNTMYVKAEIDLPKIAIELDKVTDEKNKYKNLLKLVLDKSISETTDISYELAHDGIKGYQVLESRLVNLYNENEEIKEFIKEIEQERVSKEVASE